MMSVGIVQLVHSLLDPPISLIFQNIGKKAAEKSRVHSSNPDHSDLDSSLSMSSPHGSASPYSEEKDLKRTTSGLSTFSAVTSVPKKMSSGFNKVVAAGSTAVKGTFSKKGEYPDEADFLKVCDADTMLHQQ